ncbi:hypothetical protein B0H19DRAFT_1170030 [Mycena capillaripes]|nr:hypothetical protein B0H19DRAFT_1170030 [Mycena capillaripes]
MKPSGSQNSNSANFMKVFESLPPEAKHSLVEKKLAPLLDLVPKERAKKVMKSVNNFQSKYTGIPTLDLTRKTKEINGLLDELARDSKRAIVRERSNRDELLTEIVDSMLGWLNDIWTVVYEYNAYFNEAHACLLFVAEVLNTLNNIPGLGGQCRCSIAFLPINLAIRRKGRTIKQFNLAGPSNIDRALLWIWRDLFLSMFAKGIRTEKIPGMLSDIEEILGWKGLERMLYGGSKMGSPNFREDDDEDLDPFMDDGCMEDDSDEDEIEGSWRCPCSLHASHWSTTINGHRTKLRDLVYQHLLGLFELTPSYKIFSSILSISPDAEETEAELLETLSSIAGTSADTLVAALEIHGSEDNPSELMDLLNEHSYLLRPRDAQALQNAVNILSDYAAFRPRALEIAEKELLDTAAAVRAAVRVAFCRVEEKAPGEALAQITKLRSDNPQRQQRVQAWVDSVVTPGSHVAHPMAFAAMIMGFPLAPGMEDGDEMDMLGFLDMDSRDPDLQDLRDEFRPKLRERFEGWVSAVGAMKGGNVMLGKLYFKIVEEMPYFKLNDVTEEMLNRLSERPNKVHVTDAVDGVLSFCKSQRKKLSVRAEKRRKNEAAKKAAASSSSETPTPAPAPTPAPSQNIAQRSGYPFSCFTSSSAAPTAGPSSSTFPGPGGMEDVD